MVDVRCVSKYEIGEIWPQVNGFIESGLPKEIRLFDLIDVKSNLENGQWMLAVAQEKNAIEGAVVLGLDTYPKCRAVSIISLGGKEGRKWFDKMSDLIENVRITTG